MNDIYTIELNLDDDFASSCAYHVDDLMTTITRNISHAERQKNTNRWVLVGLARSRDEAHEKCFELQQLLCKRNNRKLKDLNDLLEGIAKECLELDENEVDFEEAHDNFCTEKEEANDDLYEYTIVNEDGFYTFDGDNIEISEDEIIILSKEKITVHIKKWDLWYISRWPKNAQN